jgi:hypothetical protein
MAREIGYVSPLLSNIAVDWSKEVRKDLVAPLLFPRVGVSTPSGKYAVFDKDNAYKVPDVTMAGERSQATEFNTSGKMKQYATIRYGLKSFIDNADLEFMDGPFKTWEKKKTELLVGKLELAQEKRVADAVLSLNGRTTSLSGEGVDRTNKWSGASDVAGGNPYESIRAGIQQLFFRPNTMILSEAVFDVLEYHPRLLDKLGEANLIKKVSEETLQKLFRIDKVIIAKGRADFTKQTASQSTTASGIWGYCVVLAYVSSIWDDPCAGKTLCVNYKESDGAGYVVRTWEEQDGGILGGEYVQVAHDVSELVIASDLIYTIKDVL